MKTATPTSALSPQSFERKISALARNAVAPRLALLPLRTKLSLAWVAVLLLLTAIGPAIAPFGSNEIGVGNPDASPTLAHLFGTDDYGRDVLSRVISGTHVSMIAGLVASLAALAAGGLIGVGAAVSAGGRRWIDELLMRLMDIQLAFPGIVLAIVFATVIGPGLLTTLLLLSIVYTPIVARFVRGIVIAQLNLDYVVAERTIGGTMRRIIVRHVTPNVVTPIVVFLTLVAADAIVLESGLSYLGAGVRPPAPSWGNMIRDGQTQLLAGQWWVTVFPGLAILGAVVALNTVAESFSDRVAGRYHLLGGSTRSDEP